MAEFSAEIPKNPFKVVEPIAEKINDDALFEHVEVSPIEQDVMEEINASLFFMKMFQKYIVKTDVAYAVAVFQYEDTRILESYPLLNHTEFVGRLVGGRSLKTEPTESEIQPVRAVCLAFESSEIKSRSVTSAEELTALREMPLQKSLYVPIFASPEAVAA